MDESVVCWKSKPIPHIAMKRYVCCYPAAEKATGLSVDEQ
jgi:hypothetical protein